MQGSSAGTLLVFWTNHVGHSRRFEQIIVGRSRHLESMPTLLHQMQIVVSCDCDNQVVMTRYLKPAIWNYISGPSPGRDAVLPLVENLSRRVQHSTN